jgi:glycosidase
LRQRDHLRESLRGLYKEREADLLHDCLKKKIEERRIPPPERGSEARELTERDVLLIAYPDQVREAGSAPLASLADFCRRHFEGLLPDLHVLPFFPSTSDDGFSVSDYRRVDPNLGTWDDISRLRTDFRLMFDAVINHTSVRHAWFRSFLRGEPAFGNFYIRVPPDADLSAVTRPRTSPLTHHFSTDSREDAVWTTFSSDQADLNYRNPDVLREIADLLLFYADRGAGFLRMDAAAYLWKEIGTSCLNLPQTHRLIQVLRTVLDGAAPGVKLVTETNVSHAENVRYFGDGTDEAHLVYNFALPPMILHTFHAGDHGRLTKWLNGLSLPGRKVAFLNFLASHDGIGLRAVRDILPEADIRKLVQKTLDHQGRVSFRGAGCDGDIPYELNINFFDALSDPRGGEPPELQIARFLAAHAILLSLAGVPAIYFHSLVGSRGWIQGVDRTGKNRAINRQKLERAILEAELGNPESLRSRVLQGMLRLIRARTRSSAFDPYGTQRSLHDSGPVFTLVRVSPRDGERILCVQNVTGRIQSLDVNLESIFGADPSVAWVTDLITEKRCRIRREKSLRLEPYQGFWFRPARRNAPPCKERIPTP